MYLCFINCVWPPSNHQENTKKGNYETKRYSRIYISYILGFVMEKYQVFII